MKYYIAILSLTIAFCGVFTTGCGTIHAITHSSVFHVDSGTNAPAPSPTSVKAAVQKEVHWMWFVAVLLAIAAGVAAYPFQNYFMAIKLGLAALTLPIIATIWSLYWGWFVAGIFVAIAIVAYLHYRVVINPAISKLESLVKYKLPPQSLPTTTPPAPPV